MGMFAKAKANVQAKQEKEQQQNTGPSNAYPGGFGGKNFLS